MPAVAWVMTVPIGQPSAVSVRIPYASEATAPVHVIVAEVAPAGTAAQEAVRTVPPVPNSLLVARVPPRTYALGSAVLIAG